MAGGDGVAGMVSDPFTSALRQPDLMERLAAVPDVRKHMADTGFMKEIERLRAMAADRCATSSDITAACKVGQEIAKVAQRDPRIMQAMMALQGQHLYVDEQDLKRAENVGDMKRREPVQLENLALVKDITSVDEAKAKGNEYFKAGDLNNALAHYEKGIALLRDAEELPAATLATLLSNATQCLLKLNWPDRAKQTASQAIAVIRKAEDATFDQSKLFFRRALASEQLKDYNLAVEDMARAMQHAKQRELPLAEQHRLQAEVRRLVKLKDSADGEAEKRRQQQENERQAEVQRMQGAELAPKAPKAAPPVSADYLQEQDFSHWARKRLTEAVVGVSYKCPGGGFILITELQEQSKVQASVTTKRGHRALYYEMDLHCLWLGKVTEGEMQGLFRLYNVAHDTKFQLGGDENTSYMYQLGWDQRLSGPWVEQLRTEATELFDLVAAAVDTVIEELRKK